MGYEISTTCFYLTKRGLTQKANEPELLTELKNMITKIVPTHLPPTDHHRNVIINFMTHDRKVSIKKQNLKTYNDFCINLWRTFSFLQKSCNQMDIVFDVYKELKQISEEEEQQVKAKKQLFQVFINFYLWKLIYSRLYQRIRQHSNNSSQSGYPTRLNLNNLMNRYSQVVRTKKTMRCVLALSMDWLVLKGYWNAHLKRPTIAIFPCTPRNKDQKLWKCCYCFS